MIELAIRAARAAGAIQRARRPKGLRHKGAVDLVTEVDLASEEAIREILAPSGVPVLGEECGGEDVPTRWVVDPLDGTTNFVHGFPYFCVSIALEVDGRGAVAAIYDPSRDELFAAERGRGATCNGEPIRVSYCDGIGTALVGTGFPYDRQQLAHVYLAEVEAVMRRSQGIRRAGAAALDLANVAAGRLDAFWEHKLRPWDVAAGRLLVEEAGGTVTGHDGGDPGRDPVAPLATNGRLHAEMVAILAAVPRVG